MLKNLIEFATDNTLRRYQELFVSLNRSLCDALDRATTQFKEHMTSKGDVCENAVKKYGNRIPPYPETQHYVRKVIDFYLNERRQSRS